MIIPRHPNSVVGQDWLVIIASAQPYPSMLDVAEVAVLEDYWGLKSRNLHEDPDAIFAGVLWENCRPSTPYLVLYGATGA